MQKNEISWFRESLKNLRKYSQSRLQKSISEIEKILNNIEKLTEKFKASLKKTEKKIIKNRETLKGRFYNSPVKSDQSKGIPNPPLEKEYDSDSEIIELPQPDKSILKKTNIYDCIRERFSRRKFTNEDLSLEELSFLLWSTQGIKKLVADGKVSLRTVPSAGARHPFETYLGINRVTGLKKGVYRYLPVEHKLVFLFTDKKFEKKINTAVFLQSFVGDSAVVFIWSTIPYRTEWRYPLTGHKVILLDAGHICQNLYLSAEAIKCGTCAIAAYDQKKMDKLLKLDGKNEFVIYLAPVGKLKFS
ncbi:SagB/ThcOx family dehydrogenase [Candidatus Dependentiae bacterium]|nr:SagB/ThcOx family dehydrogenase [Candidatus Dependentiae bacterium]